MKKPPLIGRIRDWLGKAGLIRRKVPEYTRKTPRDPNRKPGEDRKAPPAPSFPKVRQLSPLEQKIKDKFHPQPISEKQAPHVWSGTYEEKKIPEAPKAPKAPEGYPPPVNDQTAHRDYAGKVLQHPTEPKQKGSWAEHLVSGLGSLQNVATQKPQIETINTGMQTQSAAPIESPMFPGPASGPLKVIETYWMA